MTAERDVTTTGSGSDEFKMIGIGGRLSDGDFTIDDIDVTATTGALNLSAGGARGFAMIGLGGHQSGGNFLVNNDIDVTAAGDITLETVDAGGAGIYNDWPWRV